MSISATVIRRAFLPQRPDPGIAAPAAELAIRLGISAAAVELTRDAEPVDLHLDTHIPMRTSDYDPLQRHPAALLGRRFFGHVDLPRLVDGGLAGGMWSITTNPFRSARRRWALFQQNLAGLRALLARSEGRLVEVHTLAEYRAARARGAHAVLPSIQGANALEAVPSVDAIPGGGIVRMTIVHLTNACYGATSSPVGGWRTSKRLTPRGRDLVAQLDARRIFVDLAHAHPETFWDAVRAHDPTLPLVATHTGVTGVRPHWRNLDDDQLRAIADTGGVVGVIFNVPFLSRRDGPRDGAMIVEHLEHIIRVAGEDTAAIGSDFDGAITAPADVAGADQYPRLVQRMLDRGWSEHRIRKVLSGNFLRALGALRPG